MNLEEHLQRQIAVSIAMFGSVDRTADIAEKIAEKVADLDSLDDWSDVIVLALEGLTCTLMCADFTANEAAALACRLIAAAQQNHNECLDGARL